MLAPKEKSPLLEKFLSEEDRTHDAASRRAGNPTHYQRAILAPETYEYGDACKYKSATGFLLLSPSLTHTETNSNTVYRLYTAKSYNTTEDKPDRCQTENPLMLGWSNSFPMDSIYCVD